MRLLPRVVLVDDDPRRSEVVSLVIRGAFGDAPLTVAGDGVALARRLHDAAVGLVLVRSGLAWAPVLEVAALLREVQPDAGLVVLLDRPEEEAVETALRAGADGVVCAAAGGLARLPEALHSAIFRARRRRLAAGRDRPYRSLFRSMAHGAFVADRDGTLLEVNPAMATLLGVEGPERLARRSIGDLLTDPRSSQAWRDGLAGPAGAVGLEVTMRGPGGPPVRVRLHAWRVPAAGDGEDAVHGTLEAAGPSGAERAAPEDAPQPSAEIEQLASAISHDLRQSLRVVDRSLELLSGSAGDRLAQDEVAHVERARAAATDLDRLLEGILRWARLPVPGEALDPVALDRVLDRVLERLESERRERAATIAREPLPPVAADESQMELLLQNLLDNALKFGGDGPPRIHVSAHREDGGWRISVADSGIGIEPAAAERVFGLFQRQEGPQETPGHGIGLAVCRRIVAGHGGRIWVESRPGAGATFHFTLPDRGAHGADGGQP